MEKKNEKQPIGMYSLLCLSSFSCAIMTLCNNNLRTKVLAIYALPVVFVVFVALIFAITVLLIKNKHFKFLWFSAIGILLSVLFVSEVCGCVKDITGGTETVRTDCFRILNDKILCYGDEETVTFKLDKKMVEYAGDHCNFEGPEVKTVTKGIVTLNTCTETAEITYYPNTRTVADITFSPKQSE